MDRTASLELRTLPGPFGAAEVIGLDPADAHDESKHGLLQDVLARRADVCVRQPRALDPAVFRVGGTK